MPSSRSPKPRRTPNLGSRPGGRPTTDETAQISRDIRHAALDVFLERGYEGASLDDVAAKARTTKASLYVRFADKESMFTGVMRWALERPDWPDPESEPLDIDNLDDLEGALRSIADAALRRATHPSVVRLTQIAIAQTRRFPDLAQRAFAASWSRKPFIVKLLQHHASRGAIVADEPEILAEHFLGLVSGMPAHLSSFGFDRDAATQRRYGDVAIELFLRGLRPD
jgi:AcrR family transcriptional regulator